MLFWGDYYLRWWRLPIEERACRETDLGGGDYYLRNSGLPPSSNPGFLDPQFTPMGRVCVNVSPQYFYKYLYNLSLDIFQVY